MRRQRRKVRCPWCVSVIPTSEIEVRRYRNDYGTVIERRCTKCSKVLAAYLEEEGDFLSKMRTF